METRAKTFAKLNQPFVVTRAKGLKAKGNENAMGQSTPRGRPRLLTTPLSSESSNVPRSERGRNRRPYKMVTRMMSEDEDDDYTPSTSKFRQKANARPRKEEEGRQRRKGRSKSLVSDTTYQNELSEDEEEDLHDVDSRNVSSEGANSRRKTPRHSLSPKMPKLAAVTDEREVQADQSPGHHKSEMTQTDRHSYSPKKSKLECLDKAIQVNSNYIDKEHDMSSESTVEQRKEEKSEETTESAGNLPNSSVNLVQNISPDQPTVTVQQESMPQSPGIHKSEKTETGPSPKKPRLDTVIEQQKSKPQADQSPGEQPEVNKYQYSGGRTLQLTPAFNPPLHNCPDCKCATFLTRPVSIGQPSTPSNIPFNDVTMDALTYYIPMFELLRKLGSLIVQRPEIEFLALIHLKRLMEVIGRGHSQLWLPNYFLSLLSIPAPNIDQLASEIILTPLTPERGQPTGFTENPGNSTGEPQGGFTSRYDANQGTENNWQDIPEKCSQFQGFIGVSNQFQGTTGWMTTQPIRPIPCPSVPGTSTGLEPSPGPSTRLQPIPRPSSLFQKPKPDNCNGDILHNGNLSDEQDINVDEVDFPVDVVDLEN